jgi:xanthine/uracil/vitamin C permease (AzgA family)
MAEAVSNAGAQVLEFGHFNDPGVLLAIIGLVITGLLMVRKVKGSLFIGIIATTVIGLLYGRYSIARTDYPKRFVPGTYLYEDGFCRTA